MTCCRVARPLLALCLCGTATALSAQEAETDADAGADARPAPAPAQTAQGRVYEPAFFAQFGPRTALDMVERIPGFAIQSGDDGARGLGQARQNVIVNSERLSSKSDNVVDQLQRIPAGDVVRIEVVDGTTLDIPGLTGQVANVVVASSGLSGQFRYRAGYRPATALAQLYGGEVSLTSRTGALDFTVSLSNNNERSGIEGPILVTAADGALIERQDTRRITRFDNPVLSTAFAYTFAPQVSANLNLKYGADFFSRSEPETGTPVSGPIRFREAEYDEDGPEYEIGGDFQFPLGPGQLKLIGLERFERDNGLSVVIDRFSDGSPAQGSRFAQVNEIGERIGRFEYGWGLFGAEWQLAGEAAFNRLDRVSGLERLDGAGAFQPVPFPAGTGGVREDRYEAILSVSKALTSTLAVQASGGGEYSRLEQTGSAANSRSFQRPKGSASLAWNPAPDFDASARISRVVGQLSFGDFLASVALNEDNENRGNNALVPAQSWEFDLEANQRLGPWGSFKLEFARKWFEDFIDFFPLASGGEARGNIGSADATRLTGTATLKLDPLGIAGAQFDVTGMASDLAVTDPFTGRRRAISNNTLQFLDARFRHDVPGTQFAYGGSYFTATNAGYSRRFEIGRNFEGPGFLGVFVEHKDVLGMTVNAEAGNILGATNNLERVVFAGSRPFAPVAFRESAQRRIGPIFNLTVSGNF